MPPLPAENAPPKHTEMPANQRRYPNNQSKDIISQITGMSAIVPPGELLRSAPSVRRGVVSLLDGYGRVPSANMCSVHSIEESPESLNNGYF